MFYELDADEADQFEEPETTEIDDFPDELVALINQYRPVELKGLQDDLLETKRELRALKTDIATDKTWRDDFKRDLSDLKQVVSETSRNVTRLPVKDFPD
jgi:hypothetical protein